MNTSIVEPGRINVARWDGRDGPPILLVHGLGGSHLNWMRVGPLLAARGPVLAPDLPGFGYSPLGEARASVTTYVEMLARFVEDVVGEPPIVVGNSMGGHLATILAAEHPAHVRGLVLVGPAVPRSGAQIERKIAGAFAAVLVPAVGEGLVTMRLRMLGAEGVARQTLEICTVDPSRIPREVVDAHLELARARLTMPWARDAFVQATRSLIRSIVRARRFARAVAEVSAPALVLHGRQDRLVPLAAVERLAARRPDWDLVVFDHLGHAPMLEDPDAVAAAIGAWLEGPNARVLTGRPRARRPEPSGPGDLLHVVDRGEDPVP